MLFKKLIKTSNSRTIMLYKEWDKRFSSIYKNYRNYQTKRRFNSKRAKEARSHVKPESNFLKGIKSNLGNNPINPLEKKIQSRLKKLKLDFRTHYLIDGINKKFIPDFVIFKNGIPRIIVEVKQSNSKNKRRQYDLLKMHVIRLDHKMQNIKLKWPDIKTIAVLSSKNLPIKTLSPYLKAEFLNTDKVLIDSNLSELQTYIPYVLKKAF